MDKMVFSVYAAGRGPREAYAVLDLPATPYEIEDALEKVRLQPDEELLLEIEEYYDFGFLAPYLEDVNNLHGLNALAQRLSQFVDYEYDKPSTVFYCDPPYYEAEDHYAVEFSMRDHARLHYVLRKAKGFVMVSYNDCRFIRRLYKDFYIFRTDRPNSMSRRAGSRYGELVMTNYNPEKHRDGVQMALFDMAVGEKKDQKYKRINKPKVELWSKNNAEEKT